MRENKIIFVTGTDTGVGKTLLSALLLHHLRQSRVHALAMKPFCSGGLGDVRLLQSLQPGELSDAEANPFYFPQPIAPLVAARKRANKIGLAEVVQRIREVQRKCELLIIEGSGGLLVPLGEGYTVADLIARMNCHVIVAARNQLGTLNHTLLTIQALQNWGIEPRNIAIVFMSARKTDLSSRTNPQVTARLLPKIPVFVVPFLGLNVSNALAVKAKYSLVKPLFKKLIARLGKNQKRPKKSENQGIESK